MSAETQNLIEKSLVGQIIDGLGRNKTSWTKEEFSDALRIQSKKLTNPIKLISDGGAGILKLRRCGKNSMYDISNDWNLNELEEYFRKPPHLPGNLGERSKPAEEDDTV